MSEYESVGRLRAGDFARDPRVDRVKAVTLDGVEVPLVIELDDREGWLRRWMPGPGNNHEPLIERLDGEVRVIWKD